MNSGRGQTKRFRFPGYDGELPKATRSLRGRGECQRNLFKSPKDMTVFELLATVAGQILQERDRHATVEPDNESTDAIEKKNRKAGRIFNHHCHDNSKKTTEDSNRNIPISHQHRCTEDDTTAKQKIPLQESVVKDSELAKFDSVCANSSEDGASYKVECAVPENLTQHPHEHGSPDMETHSEGHESDNTNYSHRNANAEGSCMTARDSSLNDETPPPLSSGSSEDAPTSVHKDMCSDMPLEYRHDVVRCKATDDDDNFSGTVASETAPPQRSARPLKISQAQLPHVTKDNVAGLKRKRFQDDDVVQKCISNAQYTPIQPKEKKQRVACGSSNLYSSLNDSSNAKFSDSDGKDSSDAASSPTTKGSRRSPKKKLRESHDPSAVKVNISSFAVPELSINLPESATIANLKRAVMEEAINLLGGGLHVHVLHQGEKVFDESTTLVQMGLSCPERADALTFMLEPNQIANTSANTQDPLLPLSSAPPEPASWYPFSSLGYGMDGNKKVVNGRSCIHLAIDALDYQAKQGECGMVNQSGRALESHQCIHPGGVPAMSGALILHPGLKNNETMDIVKVETNLQGTGVGKRRARRPFTVAEVEALVQAVELLGTGRWREVKQQAFDHARHRTYVDLKDKWKTLVHTAHIAPHQRRGEPVPQELLDRVLKAHMFWSEQQAKQQDDIRT